MKGITNLWGREPTMILAFVQAIIALLAGYEVIDVTQEQAGLILTVTAIFLGLLTRTQVTPYPPVNQPPVNPPLEQPLEDFGD